MRLKGRFDLLQQGSVSRKLRFIFRELPIEIHTVQGMRQTKGQEIILELLARLRISDHSGEALRALPPPDRNEDARPITIFRGTQSG